MTVKPLILTVGDPAGIGPDLCLDILRGSFSVPLVAVGDREVLAVRAAMRGDSFSADDYVPGAVRQTAILHCPADAVECGKLSPHNAAHVLAQLRIATKGCADGVFFGNDYRTGQQTNDMRSGI